MGRETTIENDLLRRAHHQAETHEQIPCALNRKSLQIPELRTHHEKTPAAIDEFLENTIQNKIKAGVAMALIESRTKWIPTSAASPTIPTPFYPIGNRPSSQHPLSVDAA